MEQVMKKDEIYAKRYVMERPRQIERKITY